MALAMGKDIEDMVQSPHQPGWVPGTGGVLLPVVGGAGEEEALPVDL